MAHNGGPRVPPRPPPAPLPRVHRAPATMSTPPAPLTVPLSPLGPRRRTLSPIALTATAASSTASPTTVTLTAPRPDDERTVNEYVETPFRPAGAVVLPTTTPVTHFSHIATHPPHVVHSVPCPTATTTTSSNVSKALLSPSPTPLQAAHHHICTRHQQQQERARPATLPLQVSVVTKQPASATFTKSPTSVGATGTTECPTRGSIICASCGRCRCESCAQPRALPQRWVCGDACLCSADAAIDYASCLCCVKGLFYHCARDSGDADGAACADDPCGCAPSRRFARWTCLAALAVALPCLLCYWPLRGCARTLEAVYARHSRTGCRCTPTTNRHATLHTPEKRLLDSSPDF